jgi:hypothetical protein
LAPGGTVPAGNLAPGGGFRERSNLNHG